MANEISLVTASGRTVTPKDDGIIYEVFSPGDGIIYGGAVTIKDSSTLHITAGHGIVCGRKFTIDDSDIPVALSGSGSLLGRLYIHLDLADAADPITLLVETGASLTPVVQDADVNINNGVFEINIATFDVDTSTISNLVNLDVTVAPMGDMEGATSALDGKGGYVPAPQAGDEDKVLKGDGTWGMAGDTATVRYNDTTDRFEVLFNGSWAQSIKAWVQSVAIWVNGVFGVEIENGIYPIDSVNYPTPRPFAVEPTYLFGDVNSGQAATIVTKNPIDLTNYSVLTMKYRKQSGGTIGSQQTMAVNVSDLSNVAYVAVFFGNLNGSYCEIGLHVSSTKSPTISSGSIRNATVNASNIKLLIDEITLE